MNLEPALLAARSAAVTSEVARATVGLLDLTTLNATDTEATVNALCARAVAPGPGLPHVGAVCVHAVLVPAARRALGPASPVRLACVAGAFPHGMTPLHLRIAEVRWCVEEGADEIDMVISRGALLAGEDAFVHDEIAAHKAASGAASLKVILETGELVRPDAILRASRIALAAGADFLKTSTGKVQPAATLEASALMLQALHDHRIATGRVVGFKAAGGLRTAQDAASYVALVAAILGPDGVHPDRLRLGASTLLDALVTAAG